MFVCTCIYIYILIHTYTYIYYMIWFLKIFNLVFFFFFVKKKTIFNLFCYIVNTPHAPDHHSFTARRANVTNSICMWWRPNWTTQTQQVPRAVARHCAILAINSRPGHKLRAPSRRVAPFNLYISSPKIPPLYNYKISLFFFPSFFSLYFLFFSSFFRSQE